MADLSAMPLLAITLVAEWLSNFERGRPKDSQGYMDYREVEECQEMARFAATCRTANDSLHEELQVMAEDAAENAAEYDARELRIASCMQDMGDFSDAYPEHLYTLVRDMDGAQFPILRSDLELGHPDIDSD